MQIQKAAKKSRADLQIRKAALGQWQTNCYVLICSQTNESIILDPGDQADGIMKLAEGTKVQRIIITHGHFDHTGALEEVRAATGAPVGFHPSDADRIPAVPDFTLEDGQLISFGHIRLRVIHTPGHTPGSICLLRGQDLLSGDTIFPGGPGATKTPANLEQILKSISDKILPLPDRTVIHPGHGGGTTLGKEREAITLFMQRPRDPDLCGDVTWLPS